MKVKNEQPGMQKFTAAVKRNFFHLTENWPIKIICLVLAIFLSEFYRGTLLDKKYLVVPLKLENDGRMAPAE